MEGLAFIKSYHDFNPSIDRFIPYTELQAPRIAVHPLDPIVSIWGLPFSNSGIFIWLSESVIFEGWVCSSIWGSHCAKGYIYFRKYILYSLKLALDIRKKLKLL